MTKEHGMARINITSLTLMSQPLALLDIVRRGSKSHEVAFHNEAGMLLTEEEWDLALGRHATLSRYVV